MSDIPGTPDGAMLTSEVYEPGGGIADRIEDLGGSIRLVDKTEQEIEVLDQPAIKGEHSAVLDDDAVDVHETQSAVGVQVSVTGPIGLAAAYVLTNALAWGEPTLLYADELPPGPGAERYQDLTAEWYHPEVIEKGVADARREQLGERYEAIDLELLEDLADVYLE